MLPYTNNVGNFMGPILDSHIIHILSLMAPLRNSMVAPFFGLRAKTFGELASTTRDLYWLKYVHAVRT